MQRWSSAVSLMWNSLVTRARTTHWLKKSRFRGTEAHDEIFKALSTVYLTNHQTLVNHQLGSKMTIDEALQFPQQSVAGWMKPDKALSNCIDSFIGRRIHGANQRSIQQINDDELSEREHWMISIVWIDWIARGSNEHKKYCFQSCWMFSWLRWFHYSRQVQSAFTGGNQ